MHVGDVLSEGGDVFGKAVNIASRLQTMANPGEVLLSKAVAELCDDAIPYELESEGLHTLKNISRPVEVLALKPQNKSENTPQTEGLASPHIRFCKSSDGATLAWTTSGHGRQLIKVANWISHLELDWRNPGTGHMLASLGRLFEVVRYDSRGNGMSDWDVPEISFELFVEDLKTIFDASGVERAPLLALSQGCAVAAAFAAYYPERVSAIAMIGGFPQGRALRPSTKDAERAKAMQSIMRTAWDDETLSLRDMMAELIVPLASVEERKRFAEDMREMISPENMGRIRRVIDEIDVVDLLPRITCPCLIVHGRDERMHPLQQSRLMASEISQSRLIALDTSNHVLTANDPCWPKLERELMEFFTAAMV
ncbi:MAG: alpha/beta fold hydrolase [Pseudomonadota bacterium]